MDENKEQLIAERKRADEAIRASEEWFSKVFQSSPDSIALVSCPDGRLIDVNDKFVEFTGHSREDAIGHTSLELGLWDHPADHDWFVHISRSPEGVRAFEAGLRTKSGERRDMQFSSDMIDLGDHHCLIAVGRDVTRHKQVEHVLRESQSRLQLVMQASNVGLWEWNLLTNEAIFSTEYKRQLGYTDEELPDRFEEWDSRLHPDDRTRTLAASSDFQEGLRPTYDVEFRLRHRDGSWRWILSRADAVRDTSGRAIRMMGCHVDITERKRAEEALIVSERFAFSTLDSLTANIAILDEEGVILRVNRAWRDFASQNSANVAGLCEGANYLQICESASREDQQTVQAFATGIRSVMAGVTEEFSIVYPCHSPTEQRWFVERVTRFRDDGPMRIVVSHTDITERKLAEDAVRDSEARLVGLVNSAMDAIITIDEDQNVVLFNPTAERIFQRSTGDVMGKSIHQFIPERFHATHPQHVQQFADSGTSVRQMGERAQVTGLRLDGSEFPAEAAILKVHVGNRKFLTVMLRDISERKLAEEAIREREGRLKLLVQAANIGLWDWNLVSNEVFFSTEWKSQLGYSNDEVTNRFEEWESRVHPDDLTRTMAAVSNFHSGLLDTFDVEFRMRHKDGSWRWILTRADMRHNATGHPNRMMGCHLDITDRKYAEALVSGQKQVLELIASDTPLAESLAALLRLCEEQSSGMFCSILLLDVDGIHMRHGAAPSLPPEYCRAIDGLAIGPRVGSCGTAVFRGEPVTVADIETDPLWRDYRDLALQHNLRACWSTPIFDAKRTILGTFAMYYNHPARPNERQLRLIDLATHTAAIAISKHREDAARLEAEMTLRASQQRFATVFRCSPVGICITRLSDGLFLDINEAFLTIVGHTREEVLGRSCLELNYWIDPDDRQRLIHVLQSGGSVRNCEMAFRRKDGTVGDSLRSFERITVDGEDCILTMLDDITERKQAASELATSRERLKMLSRQLIATQETERRHLARELHDEIGQALTGIKLNLKALHQSIHTSNLETLVTDTIAVVDQTLSQVRSLSLDLRPSMLDDIGLVAALRWCLDRQARQAGFNATFVADAADAYVAPDIATACYRVAQECLTNITRHADAQKVRVELHHREAELELLVHDDGHGFDVAAARDRAERGGSLGLLGMEERVQIVGGRITITSSPSGGTTIHAWFSLTTGSS